MTVWGCWWAIIESGVGGCAQRPSGEDKRSENERGKDGGEQNSGCETNQQALLMSSMRSDPRTHGPSPKLATEASMNIECNTDGVVAYAIAEGGGDGVGESVCCCCTLQNTLTPVQSVENQRKQICPLQAAAK